MTASLQRDERDVQDLDSPRRGAKPVELVQDRQLAEAVLAREKRRVLEMVAGSSSLSSILEAICRLVEQTSWADKHFVAAIKQTGRRNFLLAALWSEACLAFAALQMLEEGYGIYVVKDASWGTNRTAHDAALRRVEQAGGVCPTALQVLLEFQRDWARKEHYEEVMAIIREHGCPRPAIEVSKYPDVNRATGSVPKQLISETT